MNRSIIVADMFGLRIKSLIGIWAAPIANLGLRLSRRRVGLALLYHTGDTRSGEPERELVPPIERSCFRRQLRHLRRLYNVVSVEEFLPAVAHRRRGQRFPVCLTFDDDAPQHVRHALPILRQERLPATFFLCGAGLNDHPPGNTWWERLQQVFDAGHSAAEVVSLLPPAAARTLDGPPLDIHQIGGLIQALD